MRPALLACLLTILTCSAAKAGPSAPPVPPEAMVRNLYEQVVARHPLGIPYGEDMKVFAPYLSTNLLDRFDVTNACAADWLRQNPEPDLKPVVGLFEDGIFSGANEEAEPQAFYIEKSVAGKDGASQVYVKLTWDDGAEARLVWHVAVAVVRENGRLVVDDVLFLKDDSQAIDYRLSEALTAGCDGPRWVGDNTPTL